MSLKVLPHPFRQSIPLPFVRPLSRLRRQLPQRGSQGAVCPSTVIFPPFAICGEYKFAPVCYDRTEKKGGISMNQQKTGAFLAARRKELGLTQQALGEQLGVTNKTISRWETGAYLPDLATIPDLCRILDISVNEFFRGEAIPPEDLREQADQNILDIWEADKGLRRKKFWSELLGGGGTGLLLSQVYAPDTPGKAAVIIAGMVMICLGWFFRSKLEKARLP